MKNQKVHEGQFDHLFGEWHYYCDESEDCYGFSKHLVIKNRVFQIVFCKDPIYDGLYEIFSWYTGVNYIPNKKKEMLVIYPITMEMKIKGNDEKFLNKLLKDSYINEQELEFLILANQLRKQNCDFIKGLIEITTSLPNMVKHKDIAANITI